MAVTTLAIAWPAYAYPEETVPVEIRDAANPAALHVIVPQMEIEIGINPAGGGGAQQGGLVGALIAGAMDASRAKKGVSKADSIRIALDGFDIDALARTEVARAFANVDWIAGSKASFAKDPTLWGKMAVLDSGGAPYLASLMFNYSMSPDYSWITVSTQIELAAKVNPKAKKPEKRLALERLSYIKGVHAMVSLPRDPAGPIDGFAAWTANDARLLKEALASAVAKAADLSARSVTLTPADLALFGAKDRQKLSFGWHRGRIVEGQESLETAGQSNGLVRSSATVKPGAPGVLIWPGYFVHSRVLPSAK